MHFFLKKVDDLFLGRRPQNLSSPNIFQALHPNKASFPGKKSTQSMIGGHDPLGPTGYALNAISEHTYTAIMCRAPIRNTNIRHILYTTTAAAVAITVETDRPRQVLYACHIPMSASLSLSHTINILYKHGKWQKTRDYLTRSRDTVTLDAAKLAGT